MEDSGLCEEDYNLPRNYLSNLKDEDVQQLFCRICLTTDTKLISITSYKLNGAFEELTGISLVSEDCLPCKLCVECAHRLLSCIKFRNKALTANSLIMAALQQHDCLSGHTIQTIKERNHIFVSNLSIKYYPQDHYDLCLEEPEIKIEAFFEPCNNYYDNEFDIKSEELNETADEVSEPQEFPEKSVKEKIVKKNVEKIKRVKKKVVKDIAKEKRVKKNDDLGVVVDNSVLSEKKNEEVNNTEKSDEDSIFIRTELTFDQQMVHFMKRKESDNYKNSEYKCDHCYKGFFNKDCYKLHMTKHSNVNGKYHCKICKTHFKLKRQVRNHIVSVHSRQYSCKKCDYVVYNKESAKCHEKWHRGTKYKCDHCQEEFSKRSSYFSHVRIKHPSDFACQYCGFSYVSQKGVNQHILFKHKHDRATIPDDAPLCDLCNIRFVSHAALTCHKSVSPKHAGVSTRNDPAYGRRKYNKPKAKEEVGEDLLACEQCGIELRGSREYHNHFRSEHPDKNRTVYPRMKTPAMCDHCGKMFPNTATLSYHMWMHQDDKCFECDHCGKQFKTKYRLAVHMEMHSGNRRAYTCQVCSKQFCWKSNLNKHMRIHTGVRPYACEVCGKSFRVASERRAHVDYVHIRKAYPKKNRAPTRQRNRTAPVPAVYPPEAGLQLWPCEPAPDLAAMAAHLT